MMGLRVRHETFSAIFDLIYVALVTNLLLVIGCLPLMAGLLTTDPARSWPLLALVAPLCAPGLCAAFAVLAWYTTERSTAVFSTYARAWRASFRRATTVGAIMTGTLVVLGMDVAAVWGQPVGAVVIPLLVVAMILAVSSSLLVLVIIAERPTVRLRDALRACLYLAVRRWYLTVLSLVVLGLLETLMASRPAIALGLAATPLLYVVWANSRFTLNPALGPVPGLVRSAG
ncbi:MAG TPA: hypothetical protein VLL08_10975 [Kineosporiaceae bacterium]|nr:hypothetical protein [Kineosporiaceae bacterium]